MSPSLSTATAFGLLLAAPAANAFVAAPHTTRSASSVIRSAESTPEKKGLGPKNGWKYNENNFCGGLPGAIAPLGEFDPLEICYPKEQGESEVKRLREAEIMHCRVAMLAFLGYLTGEAIDPFTGSSFLVPFEVHGPANQQLAQVAPLPFAALVLFVGACEIRRAQIGWVAPTEALFTLRDDYYPGDIGFDPFQYKADMESPEDFEKMQNKELSNGRLAMLAVAGFCAQEQMNGIGIIENFGVHRTLIS
jgi:hypothetical protein